MRNLKGKEFEAKLAEILDTVSQDPAMERAMRLAGYSPKMIWLWLKRSGEGDTKYLVAWPDKKARKIQFCDAVVLARRLHKVKMDATIRSACDVGIPEVQMHDGAVLYEKDAALLAEWGDDKEAAERIGGVIDFPYKHIINEQGKRERIPLVLYRPAPAALRQHVIRSLIPSEFNPPEHRVTSTEHSGSVLILNANRPPYAKDYQAPPSPIKQDLQQRLADLRARGPAHKHATDKNGLKTIPKIGTGSVCNDPPERNGYGAAPQVDADGHIVGAKVQPMINRRTGQPAPGGFSALTGRPT
jgi:hypothetical protein